MVAAVVIAVGRFGAKKPEAALSGARTIIGIKLGGGTRGLTRSVHGLPAKY